MLIPSREEDPTKAVRFGDGQVLTVPGHGGAVAAHDGSIYMAIALRNGGDGARGAPRVARPATAELSGVSPEGAA